MAEDRRGREAALLALSVATRERLGEATIRVYLDDERISAFCDEDFAAACRALMVSDWFPKLGELLKACQQARLSRLQAQDAERQARLRLVEPSPPPSQAEATRILEKLYAATHQPPPSWWTKGASRES